MLQKPTLRKAALRFGLTALALLLLAELRCILGPLSQPFSTTCWDPPEDVPVRFVSRDGTYGLTIYTVPIVPKQVQIILHTFHPDDRRPWFSDEALNNLPGGMTRRTKLERWLRDASQRHIVGPLPPTPSIHRLSDELYERASEHPQSWYAQRYIVSAPFPIVRGDVVLGYDSTGTIVALATHRAAVNQKHLQTIGEWPGQFPLAIPYGIDVVGLLASAAVFTLVGFAASDAFRSVTYWIRDGCAKCVACGYPLAVQGSICSECGHDSASPLSDHLWFGLLLRPMLRSSPHEHQSP